MNAKLTAIYFTLIVMCTAAGFLAGEALQNVEKSFISHQRQMYFGTFPKKVRAYDMLRWQENHDLQLQLLSLATSVGGFLLGVVLVNRQGSADQLISPHLLKRDSYLV